MPRTQTHVHKYYKKDMGRKKPYIVYACALPHCYHYVPENVVPGKLTRCWGCNEEFVITKNSDGTLPVKPKCPDCKASRKKPTPILPIEDSTPPNKNRDELRKLLGLR